MKKNILTILIILICSLTACSYKNMEMFDIVSETESLIETSVDREVEYSDVVYNGITIPAYSGDAYIEVNNNVPFFYEEEYTTEPFELYSQLDDLGRCGVAYANICIELMPTEERGEIGQVKPSGWHTVKYDCVNGKYLYNRCHLIGYQLAGENANEDNLITGTRYLNIDGMLGHENMISKYVEETENHVLYRVTPVFTCNNLVADGVLMEGYSVEDNGEGIQFCIFAYNVQPGIEIDYLTGESKLIWYTEDIVEETKTYTANEEGIIYILNIESKKYHLDTCRYAESMSEENKETFNGTKEWLEDNGYSPCGVCKP